eukprot:SAG31_NODE_3994_length_3679_cov_2.233240_1_plen_166_part_00
MSSLTPIVTVFRGARGLRMPSQLEDTDKFGSRFGIEYSFMSTTVDKAVAINYGTDPKGDLSYLMEFSTDSLNRGALLTWLSQYPNEQEVLFGPLTGIELVQESVEGEMRHLVFRPTANQRTTIEELVAELHRRIGRTTEEHLRANAQELLLRIESETATKIAFHI